MEILQNFVAFSKYMNFNSLGVGNKEHIFIGQKLNGDFVKFSGLLKNHKH